MCVVRPLAGPGEFVSKVSIREGRRCWRPFLFLSARQRAHGIKQTSQRSSAAAARQGDEAELPAA